VAHCLTVTPRKRGPEEASGFKPPGQDGQTGPGHPENGSLGTSNQNTVPPLGPSSTLILPR
jgi:hypothetical protein